MNCVVSVAGEAWREGSVKDADDARRLVSPSHHMALAGDRVSQPRDMADTEDHYQHQQLDLSELSPVMTVMQMLM